MAPEAESDRHPQLSILHPRFGTLRAARGQPSSLIRVHPRPNLFRFPPPRAPQGEKTSGNQKKIVDWIFGAP
jgi:hypothetical protein